MKGAAPVLEAYGLSHSYARSEGRRRGPGPGKAGGDKRLRILDPLDLCIEEGEFVSIVGPSGCGKTTLLRILAGLTTPESGSVLDKGITVRGPDWSRSLVFQQPQLFPWLTVEENIAFGPKNRGVPRSTYGPKVEELMRLVKLRDFAGAFPHQLSGGMKQRVSLARGLANEPHILLLDEPLGALDALTREHMQDELLTIRRRTGCTVVLVTHSVEEALYLSTRVIVLSDRPARIVSEIPVGFGMEDLRGSGRAVKSSPDFLALREELIGQIWLS
jgi:ABC-type nitrate/sulfonate/bicarbonate transport system ATPase subunit